jgi:hypothetical protein
MNNSIRKACALPDHEFMPAERSGKRIRNAGSLRFVAK